MATGYMIGMGDKTSCGGKVLEGDTLISMFGIYRAREGDQVSCGKDGKIYRIIGGISYMTSSGRLVAGNLDSISGCPCGATLFPSRQVRYESQRRVAPGARLAATEGTNTPASAHPRAPQTTPRTFFQNSGASNGEEPGFHIVQKSVPREALRASLLPNPTSQAVVDRFHSLNPGSDLVKAGSIIVLSDPNNLRCTREEAVLMSAATSANQALESLSAEEADFMMEHREEIAGFLGYSSTAAGVASATYAKHLSDLKTLIEDLEKLHQRTFMRDGHLRSPAFFAERKRLLTQIDVSLGSLTRKGVGIADHPNLKSALGISSRSLTHHWNKVGAPGQIPGYATHLRGVATASKIIKAGGWIGAGLGAAASYHKVQAVCTAGSIEACERVRFTETGSFLGNLAAGAGVVLISSKIAAEICVGIGIATATVGGIICGVVAVGAVSYGAGHHGGRTGEAVGELIYRKTR